MPGGSACHKYSGNILIISDMEGKSQYEEYLVEKKFCETSGTSDCALCTISSLGKLESKFDQNFLQNPGSTFRSLDMEISFEPGCITGFDKIFLFKTSNNTCLTICFLKY